MSIFRGDTGAFIAPIYGRQQRFLPSSGAEGTKTRGTSADSRADFSVMVGW